MVLMVLPGSISHKFKRIRPLIAIALALVVLFYYTFLNEEYELNQHMDETDLPRISKQLSTDEKDAISLLTPLGLKEKNKYFPIILPENEHSKKDDFTLPDDYFENQFSQKLRQNKKKLRYPVGHENYHKFPKIKKKEDYPIVQSSYFSDGGLKVEDKLKSIRKAFSESWKVYEEYGYGHDEVKPISHRASDPFNGWSASIIDALDTMVLFGLDKEFKEAVKYIKKINFKQSYRNDIPLFENTIRILAGLISGYEVSGDKALLKSAKEFAELLMEAFDTPNNMPLLYYKWRDDIQNRFASKSACLAEVGSLSLEFSRLTQLTGDNKYYDAITRITKLFEHSFDNFLVPGLYSNRVDISGCKIIRPEQAEGVKNQHIVKVIEEARFEHCLLDGKIRPSTKTERYSMGGLGDSFYEYMPKMFHLLRGHEQESKSYKEMYLKAIKQVRDYMLFRPRIPNSENILFVSSVEAHREESQVMIVQDLDMQHLTCFAGGMFALGSRLFNISEDMDIAEKVTLGCVEMYERFKIMPESIKTDKMGDAKDLYSEAHRLALIEKSGGLSVFSKLTPDEKVAVEEKLGRQLEIAAQQEAKEAKEAKEANEAKEDAKAGESKATTDPETKDTVSKEDTEAKAEITQPEDDFDFADIEDADSEIELVQDTNVGGKVKRSELSSITPSSNQLKFNLQYQNVLVLPPYKDLEDGTKVWTVGKTRDQPLWINSMNPKYILRPEAIESVYYMYRITGDSKWRDKGWMMWENVEKYCKTSEGQFAALKDVTSLGSDKNFADSLESFWFAETLKYYYLLFEDISVWSLDDYVFNTEAHPFKLV